VLTLVSTSPLSTQLHFEKEAQAFSVEVPALELPEAVKGLGQHLMDQERPAKVRDTEGELQNRPIP